MSSHTVRAKRVGEEWSEPIEITFGHAVEKGIGYGQLWISPREHLELTAHGLRELARLALELAEGL